MADRRVMPWHCDGARRDRSRDNYRDRSRDNYRERESTRCDSARKEQLRRDEMRKASDQVMTLRRDRRGLKEGDVSIILELVAEVAVAADATTTSKILRRRLVAWSSLCRCVRALPVVRSSLLKVALTTPWVGRYRVHDVEREQFDSQNKIKRAISERIRMLQTVANLNGIDDAQRPIKAKPQYRVGTVFTGIIELTWDTLEVATVTEFCMFYSETDRVGDNHIIQLVQQSGHMASEHILAVHDVFGS